ncbi:hypothetical protein ACFS32_04545 [Novosphingobium pokkalii]|uniref:hypothetical protein n=1 Tax=Novosphingobium pokkalii TaxID=1770194 RepID=UPI0036321E6C
MSHSGSMIIGMKRPGLRRTSPEHASRSRRVPRAAPFRRLLLRGLDELVASKGGKGREVERTANAIGIHVGNARLGVVAARPHLIESVRLHAVFGTRTPHHGVQADRREDRVVPEPHVLAVALHHAGRLVLVDAGEVLEKRIGRFDRMIVHADDHHIFHFHGPPLLAASRHCRSSNFLTHRQ